MEHLYFSWAGLTSFYVSVEFRIGFPFSNWASKYANFSQYMKNKQHLENKNTGINNSLFPKTEKNTHPKPEITELHLLHK